MQLLVKKLRCASMSVAVSRPALTPRGYETRGARRWSVENTPLPGGLGPHNADVVAHFAALADLSGLVPVEVPEMSAQAVYEAAVRALPSCGDAVAIVARDGRDVWAVYADADGIPDLVEAKADEAQAAKWADACARERDVCDGADVGARMWRECIAKALADPEVMAPIFDACDAMAIEHVRERFGQADYVQSARDTIHLLPCAK